MNSRFHRPNYHGVQPRFGNKSDVLPDRFQVDLNDGMELNLGLPEPPPNFRQKSQPSQNQTTTTQQPQQETQSYQQQEQQSQEQQKNEGRFGNLKETNQDQGNFEFGTPPPVDTHYQNNQQYNQNNDTYNKRGRFDFRGGPPPQRKGRGRFDQGPPSLSSTTTTTTTTTGKGGRFRTVAPPTTEQGYGDEQSAYQKSSYSDLQESLGAPPPIGESRFGGGGGGRRRHHHHHHQHHQHHHQQYQQQQQQQPRRFGSRFDIGGPTENDIPQTGPYQFIVSNLSFRTQEETIAAALEQVPKAIKKTRKGQAQITFDTREQAIAALSLHGKNIDGKKVRLVVAAPNLASQFDNLPTTTQYDDQKEETQKDNRIYLDDEDPFGGSKPVSLY